MEQNKYGWSNSVLVKTQDCDPNTQYYNEVYRLDWDLVWVTALPEIPVHPNNPTLIPLVPWNLLTITWERRALKWRYLRETQQNSELDVNSRTYRAWFWSVYLEQWHAERITDEDSVFVHEKTFEAKPWMYVEIHVQREV